MALRELAERSTALRTQLTALAAQQKGLAKEAAWEEALFHCFNRLREKEHKLLICADQNPAQLAIELPDLRSRLATGLIYQLPSMTDALKHFSSSSKTSPTHL